MEHDDNTKEALLSKRRNRLVETIQYQQPKQKRHHQPDLKIVNEDYVQHRARRVDLIPKSLNQETYIDLLNNPQKLIIFDAT